MSVAPDQLATGVRADVRAPLQEESDIWAARSKVRSACEKAGLSAAATESLATAVSEIARNVLAYGGGGELVVGVLVDERRRGVVVRAQDMGPGIADLTAAMTDGYSTGRGLGLGLPSARRLVDNFTIASTPGKGTIVTMWKWVRPT